METVDRMDRRARFPQTRGWMNNRVRNAICPGAVKRLQSKVFEIPGGRIMARFIVILMAALFLTACGPSQEERRRAYWKKQQAINKKEQKKARNLRIRKRTKLLQKREAEFKRRGYGY